MSGGMPELGSKISLISKADIRYEGRLYTVDPTECTIALSSVRSFGTEDRETQFQIAPQSQIYDYILFRGSDIKDIRVVNNGMPHPNDPAIMQVQLPNGQHLMPHFPMPAMNPPIGNYGNPFGMGGLSGMGSSGLAPGGAAGSFMLNNNKPSKQPSELNDAIPQELNLNALSNNQQSTVGGALNINATSILPPANVAISSNSAAEHKDQDLLAGASRSTTPVSLISRKSPSADMAVQVNQQPQQQQQQQQQQQSQQHNHHHQQNTGGGAGGNRDAGHKRQNHQQRGSNRNVGGNDSNSGGYYNRERRDSGRLIDHQHNNNNYNQGHQHQQHDNRSNHYNNNQRNNHQNQSHQQLSSGGNGQNSRGWTMNRGQNNSHMARNRGGRGRMPHQGFRQIGGSGGTGVNQSKNNRTKNTIKFEQDFDFEQANNKFEELRSQFSKLKVGDEPKNEQINGETDKKDDSGNETGAGEHEPEDEDITVGYDKTKSFFDNISCEAAQDRSKSKKNDWRQERKLNSETFGVSSTRRGNYRGRGNYYNRNMNNYSGYNRNYRGGSNYNRNNNRNNRTIGGSAGASGGGGNGGNGTDASGNNDQNNLPSKNQNVQQQQNQSTNQKTQDNNSQPQVAVAVAGQ